MKKLTLVAALILLTACNSTPRESVVGYKTTPYKSQQVAATTAQLEVQVDRITEELIAANSED